MIVLASVVTVEKSNGVIVLVSVLVPLNSMVVDEIDDSEPSAVEVRVAVFTVFSEVVVVSVHVGGVTDVTIRSLTVDVASESLVVVVGNVCTLDGTDVCGNSVVIGTDGDEVVVGKDMFVEGILIGCVVPDVVVVLRFVWFDVVVTMVVVGVDEVVSEFAKVIVLV